MPDAEDDLKITCLSPGIEEEQPFSLQPGESVYLGREPQPAGASITLSGATSRVSRTAAKITFQDGKVLVKKISSGSDGVVTEEFNCFIPGESRETLRDGQQHTFDKPGYFEIPDTEGTHEVHLDFETPVYPVGGSPVAIDNDVEKSINKNLEVWKELYTRSPLRTQACLALVAAWFIHDFELIPAETIPNNKQLALLCGKSENSVNNALYRTRTFLDPRQADVDNGVISQQHCDRGPLVDRSFRDEDLMGDVKWGNQELAKWVMLVSTGADPRPITLADILELDGLTNPTPAAQAGLRRRGN